MQLGLPVVERLDDLPDEPTIVLVAYGRLIPRDAARPAPLAERPPVAAAALAWGGARRAGDHGRRRRDRRHRDPAGGGARRRADRGAARRSRSSRRTTPGRCYDRAAEIAVELLERVLPEPSFTPQPDEGVDLRGEDRAGRPPARPLAAGGGGRTGSARSRRTSAPAPSSNDRPVTVWRARVEDGLFVPLEVQPAGGRRMGYDEWLRGSSVAPARRAAYEVVLRVFEDDAYADRVFAGAAAGLDRARPRARPADRVRHRAAGPRARPRDRGARPPARAKARPARPRGAPARRLPARLPRRRRAARGGERVGRARPGSAARAGCPVHERGDAAARATACASCSRRSRRAR